MSHTNPGVKFVQSKMHVVQDRQGTLYLAQADQLFWTTIEGEFLPLQGYKDLGSVESLLNKLAQYRHASKILLGQTQNTLLNNLELFKEIE